MAQERRCDTHQTEGARELLAARKSLRARHRTGAFDPSLNLPFFWLQFSPDRRPPNLPRATIVHARRRGILLR